MVIFSTLGKNGRLGNQLFQIAATIGIAIKNKMDYAFPFWEFAKYFKEQLPTYLSDLNTVQVLENEYKFYDIKLPLNDHIDLFGVFQSEKYFKEVEHVIRKYFEFRNEWMDELIKKNNLNTDQAYCGIHVRREDYLNSFNHIILPIDYYNNAVDYFPIGTKFLIFSDDIKWCKENLKLNVDCVFIHDNSEIEDFALMSKCTHFIIANSTFSWWAAWLGEKPGTIVLTPDRWYQDLFKLKCPEDDLIPQRWTKIPVYNPEALNKKFKNYCYQFFPRTFALMSLTCSIDGMDMQYLNITNQKSNKEYFREYFFSELNDKEENIKARLLDIYGLENLRVEILEKGAAYFSHKIPSLKNADRSDTIEKCLETDFIINEDMKVHKLKWSWTNSLIHDIKKNLDSPESLFFVLLTLSITGVKERKINKFCFDIISCFKSRNNINNATKSILELYRVPHGSDKSIEVELLVKKQFIELLKYGILIPLSVHS